MYRSSKNLQTTPRIDWVLNASERKIEKCEAIHSYFSVSLVGKKQNTRFIRFIQPQFATRSTARYTNIICILFAHVLTFHGTFLWTYDSVLVSMRLVKLSRWISSWCRVLTRFSRWSLQRAVHWSNYSRKLISRRRSCTLIAKDGCLVESFYHSAGGIELCFTTYFLLSFISLSPNLLNTKYSFS